MAVSRGGTVGSGPLKAYVLHQWDWSESSLIVELWTRERGRLAVVAKGAKRPTSNFRALLFPFHCLGVSLGRAPAEADAELFNLRAAEWMGRGPGPAGEALMSGFYANELLLRLLPRLDAHPVLWDAYADTLQALAETPATAGTAQAALRGFELALLRELGWLPDLAVVSSTQQPVRPTTLYGLHPEFGVLEEPDASLGLPGAWLLAASTALSNDAWAAVRTLSAPMGAALRHQLRRLVHYHLGASTLRTREVWRGMQQLSKPETR